MKTTTIQPHKSSLGMNANMASLVIFIAMAVVSWIPYLGWLAWGVPLAFFIMEKSSKFVKFQAATALVIGIIQAAIDIVLQIFIWILTPKDLYSAINYAMGQSWGLWALLGTISTIVGVAITVLIVYLVYKAYGYKQVELPVIGPIAMRASKKLENINVHKPEGSESKSDEDNLNL